MTGPRDGVTRSFDDLPLHFTTAGHGDPAIILVHGWSCERTFWERQIAEFADLTQVIALDLAGHGRSAARGEHRRWSMAAFARDVEHVADAAGARSFVLVGHSMGGPVALETAVAVGPRCRLVVGVDTFRDAAYYARVSAADIARHRRWFEADFAAAVAAMVAQITVPDLDPAIRARLSATMSATDAPLALAVLEALLSWDIEARWPSVRAPVATIDSAWLARASPRLELPGLVVHELDGVGHFPMLEDPAAFNALARAIIEPYLRAADRAPRSVAK
jgi:pimeloyl-ACP methyl ester carboxylesterase